MKKKKQLTCVLCFILTVSTFPVLGSLPYTEDFSSQLFMDHNLTTANWSTENLSVSMSKSQMKTFVFDDGNSFGDASVGANSLALFDINRDGYLDLFVGNNGGENKLYLNDGLGNFSGSGVVIGSETDNTRAIQLVDVDTDGDKDLVVGNYEGFTNKLYLNNGSGSFSASGTNIGSETDRTWAIDSGDVDGDGDLDLVVGNGDLTANKLYLNNGSGSFSATGINIDTDEDSTHWIKLVDVDQDGDLDVLSAGSGTNKIYFNNGDGVFGATGTDIGSDSDSTIDMAVGDIDNDGDIDLIAGNNTTTNKLYLNDGFGVFSSTGIDVGNEIDVTHMLILNDLNHDGFSDLVVANSNSEINRYYMNNKSGGFQGAINFGSNQVDSHSVIAGDIDNDGDSDVVFGNNLSLGTVYVNNLNLASGLTAKNVAGELLGSDADASYDTVLGDVNGDTYLDLIVVNNNEANKLYLGIGAGEFSTTGTIIGSETSATYSAVLGDVDGDGDLDLLTGESGTTNKLYLNDGDGFFPNSSTAGVNIGIDTDTTRDIALGDVDLDGDLDVIAVNENQRNKLYLNQGNGNFINSGIEIGIEEENSWSLAIGDVNGDGYLDLVVGNLAEKNKLYLNDGSGSFPDNTTSGIEVGSDADETRDLVLADMDADGDLDLVASSADSQGIKTYKNDGGFPDGSTAGKNTGLMNSNFSPQAKDPTISIVLADFDNDGDLDLVTGNAGVSNKLFYNLGNGVFADGRSVGSDTDDTYSVDMGDIDNDGDFDLIVGNKNQTNKIYTNLGATSYFNSNSIGEEVGSAENITRSIKLGDINNDGFLDLVEGNSAGQNMLYLNDGFGNLPDSSTAGIAIGIETDPTSDIVLGDVNNDGFLDVFAVNGGVNQNTLYLNDGSGNLPNGAAAGISVGSETQNSNKAFMADVNNDGWLDIMVVNWEGEQNTLYLNNGSGGFASGASLGVAVGSETSRTESLVMGDVNGDGFVDLIVGNSSEKNILYRNNGSGSLPNGSTAGVVIGSELDVSRSLALGDVDNDGDLDLLAGNDDNSRLYYNDGFGNFANGSTEGVTVTWCCSDNYSVVLSDMNLDGYVDLVTGTIGYQNRIYYNDRTGAFEKVFFGGTYISSDSIATTGIAVGDVNKDGVPDVVTGHIGKLNKIYFGQMIDNFGLPEQQAVSEIINNGEEIYVVKFDVNDEVNTESTRNTHIDYYLSNNDGQSWILAYPGEYTAFPASGSDLRWKAVLKSGSPLISPLLTEVTIFSDFDQDGTDDSTDLDDDNDTVPDEIDDCLTSDFDLSADIDGDGCDDADEDKDVGNDGIPDSTEGNHTFKVNISVKQRGKEVSVVYEGAGAVHVTVTIDDPDPHDKHTVRWYLNGEELTQYRDVFQDNLPSSLLSPGDHVVKMVVEDDGNPPNTVTEERTITVKKQGNGGGSGSLDFAMLVLLLSWFLCIGFYRKIWCIRFE